VVSCVSGGQWCSQICTFGLHIVLNQWIYSAVGLLHTGCGIPSKTHWSRFNQCSHSFGHNDWYETFQCLVRLSTWWYDRMSLGEAGISWGKPNWSLTLSVGCHSTLSKQIRYVVADHNQKSSGVSYSSSRYGLHINWHTRDLLVYCYCFFLLLKNYMKKWGYITWSCWMWSRSSRKLWTECLGFL